MLYTASTKDGHTIKSLNNHTSPLAQFQIGKWVTSVHPSAITQIFEKSSGILPTQGHYSIFQNVGFLGDKVLECREFVTFFIHIMTTS